MAVIIPSLFSTQSSGLSLSLLPVDSSPCSTGSKVLCLLVADPSVPMLGAFRIFKDHVLCPKPAQELGLASLHGLHGEPNAQLGPRYFKA